MQKLLLLLMVAVALAAPAMAPAATVTVSPSVDIGLPFWCDWGYDWDERCYRDDGARLPVGGVDDKVWRSALRFSLGAVPRGVTITSAKLRVFHDGTCVAPWFGEQPCSAGTYALSTHQILSADWYRDQELTFDWRPTAQARLASATSYGWISFDLTELVRGWHRGVVPNYGLLLKLADAQEDFGTSGPYLPSSAFPYAYVRPTLSVSFTTLPAY